MTRGDNGMIKGERVTFGASKTLSYVRQLGAGGTGTTFLFHDDLADVSFAIKSTTPRLAMIRQSAFAVLSKR